VIWNPFKKKYIEMIEKVQKRFLRYLNYLRYNTFTHSGNYVNYNSLLHNFEFQKLCVSRKQQDLLFLHVIINKGEIISVTSRICLNVPNSKVRHKRTFHLTKVKSDCCKNAPLHRICNCFNTICNDLNLFDQLGQFLLAVDENIVPLSLTSLCYK
jgi:hypothetical protein